MVEVNQIIVVLVGRKRVRRHDPSLLPPFRITLIAFEDPDNARFVRLLLGVYALFIHESLGNVFVART